MIEIQLSNEHDPWLFRVYGGSYYPVMLGLINRCKDPD